MHVQYLGMVKLTSRLPFPSLICKLCTQPKSWHTNTHPTTILEEKTNKIK